MMNNVSPWWRRSVLLVCVLVFGMLQATPVLAQWASGFGSDQVQKSDSWNAGFQQVAQANPSETRADWLPTSSDEPTTKAKAKNRYYVAAFYKFGCGLCIRWEQNEEHKLKAAGIDVVRVDSERNPQWGVGMNPTFWVCDRTNDTAVKQFTQGEYKTAAQLLELIEEYNEPESSCTPEVVQKPVSTGVNPVVANSGFYDNKPGSSHQSRDALIRHLQSGVHAGKFTAQDLAGMSDQELSDLHDSDHNYRAGTKYLHWTMPTSVVKPASTQVYQYSTCPNGNCGNLSSNRRQRGFLFFRW